MQMTQHEENSPHQLQIFITQRSCFIATHNVELGDIHTSHTAIVCCAVRLSKNNLSFKFHFPLELFYNSAKDTHWYTLIRNDTLDIESFWMIRCYLHLGTDTLRLSAAQNYKWYILLPSCTQCYIFSCTQKYSCIQLYIFRMLHCETHDKQWYTVIHMIYNDTHDTQR